jgi:hypothetical protein
MRPHHAAKQSTYKAKGDTMVKTGAMTKQTKRETETDHDCCDK